MWTQPGNPSVRLICVGLLLTAFSYAAEGAKAFIVSYKTACIASATLQKHLRSSAHVCSSEAVFKGFGVSRTVGTAEVFYEMPQGLRFS